MIRKNKINPICQMMKKSLQKEKADKRLKNKLDADDDLMMKADTIARKAINKDIAKRCSQTNSQKAGKDALKAMTVSALFSLLKRSYEWFCSFYKSQAKSFQIFPG